MPQNQYATLVKGLGLFGATSVAAGTMIGTAIFVVPGEMLRQVGTPFWMEVVWISAGLLSLFGALGYAELGAALPKAGGEYVYLHRSFGPLLGFVYGWTQFFVAKTGSIAAISTGFVIYLSYFFPMLRSPLWQARVGAGMTLELTGLQLFAAALIVFLSLVNILGVRRSGAIQTFFTASKLLVLGALIVLGLTLGHGSFANLRGSAAGPASGGTLAAFGVAMVSALWAYDGWNNLSMVAGEVKNPQVNIPRALIFGTLLVAGVYALTNIAYFYVLGPSGVAATDTVAADAAHQFLGRAGGSFIAIGVMISAFASLNGSILSGSRVPYALACDGLFPRALAKVEPRFRTPSASILAQCIIAALFALSGTYETLYTKVIFTEFLFYALVTGGIFILRRREPQLERPYRTWGYPYIPGIFVILSVLLLVNTVMQKRTDSLWGLLLVGSGIPAYLMWKRRSRKSEG
jgi:basic amino acid/polyamine antiporter, APA family